MRRYPRTDREIVQEETEPTAEDFAPGKVRKAIAKRAFTSPVTIFPFAISGIALVYLGLIALDPTALFALFASGFIGSASWFYHFLYKGDDLSKSYVEYLREKRNRVRGNNMQKLLEQLENIGYSDGYETANGFQKAYAKLEAFLAGEDVKNKGSSSGQNYLSLAEDTFRQGMATLQNAYDLYAALQSMDRSELENDLKRFNRDLRALQGSSEVNDLKATKIQTLTTKVGICDRQLKLYDQKTQLLDELLAQGEQFKGAFEVSLIELTDLARQNGKVFFSKNQLSGTTELEKAINAARKVEEKLRGLTDPTTAAEDEMYLKAGKKK
jgi:hypothetical protein